MEGIWIGVEAPIWMCAVGHVQEEEQDREKERERQREQERAQPHLRAPSRPGWGLSWAHSL